MKRIFVRAALSGGDITPASPMLRFGCEQNRGLRVDLVWNGI
jgi:hypothetical protein